MTRFASAFVILWLAAGAHAAGPPELPWWVELATVERLEAQLSAFPGRYHAYEFYQLAAAHAIYVRDAASLNTDRAWWPEYVKEAQWRYECWYCLSEARQGHIGLMIDLRLKIGDAAYFAGRMPAPMPCLDDLWR